jgi:predicted TIM-barrel fold metal-dependent hydrolase
MPRVARRSRTERRGIRGSDTGSGRQERRDTSAREVAAIQLPRDLQMLLRKISFVASFMHKLPNELMVPEWIFAVRKWS